MMEQVGPPGFFLFIGLLYAALAAYEAIQPQLLAAFAAAPEPDRARRLSRSKIAAALRRARRRDVEALEAKLRRRDLLAADDVLVDFYLERIPADVASTRAFERWWRDEARRHPHRLARDHRRLRRFGQAHRAAAKLAPAGSALPR